MLSSKEGADGSETWSILAHLWQLLGVILDDSAPCLERVGLTTKTFFLMSRLEEHPFPAELARVMHLPPPTVTYLVKQLEAGGFLARQAEPGDLRKFRLVMTELGGEAMAIGRVALEGTLNARLARLEPAELAAFDGVLERLARPVVD